MLLLVELRQLEGYQWGILGRAVHRVRCLADGRGDGAGARRPTAATEAQDGGRYGTQGALAEGAEVTCSRCNGPLFPDPLDLALYWCIVCGERYVKDLARFSRIPTEDERKGLKQRENSETRARSRNRRLVRR